jgi:predicted metal-dependent phosphoesterase TrpH
MAGKPSSQHRLPFYAVDLHVHTPASSCYKGPRTDDEYLNILKRYSEKGVRIIAVTDHNTLKGYKRYIEIKNRLVATKAALEVFLEYSDRIRPPSRRKRATLTVR